jgi:DNA-binding transcriptional regulator YiaG
VTPEEIKAARLRADLTQEMAGRTVGATRRTWQDWERGEREMPSTAWELFLLHVDQHPTHRLVERGKDSG